MSGDELHEAINLVIIDQTWVTYDRVGQDAVVAGTGLAADAVLAMPEMQALLAKDATIATLTAALAAERAEVERLRAELADWQGTVRAHEHMGHELSDEIDRLRAAGDALAATWPEEDRCGCNNKDCRAVVKAFDAWQEVRR